MSAYVTVNCYFCGKKFLKDRGHFNENVKLGHNFYCSRICLSKAQNKQVSLSCKNPLCLKIFKRQPNDINLKGNNYCSLSCAAKVNNSKFPKRHAIIKKCLVCDEDFTGREKYCSLKCKHESQIITKKEIIKTIQEFYKKESRIPLKRGFHNYHASRLRFGTWNKAIKTAGFEPNPVKFAKKFIALDDHKCDSFSEMIIDNWLFEKNIPHKRGIYYPNSNLKTDFLIGNFYVEFVGLSGVMKKYDFLFRKKKRLVKKLSLNLVEIYPRDLFPENRLELILSPVLGYK